MTCEMTFDNFHCLLMKYNVVKDFVICKWTISKKSSLNMFRNMSVKDRITVTLIPQFSGPLCNVLLINLIC